MSESSILARRRRLSPIASIAALTASVALALAACTPGEAETTGSPGADGDDGATAAASVGGTFAVGQRQAPTNLDPATANPPSYVFPAYEPLIYQEADGTLVPALATAWGYTDDTMTSFEVTLREGVVFSDGDALDAEAVKGSLDRFLTTEGPNAAYAGPVESIEATGDDTVVIHYSTAFPVAALSLSQDWRFGLIVSPTGVANPEALATESHGAGQYVLDSSATIDGSAYTYTVNENYWNADAVKFDEVVLTVMADSNAQLAALESGQIDYANNPDTLTVATAVDEGFVSVPSSGGIWLLMLVGRDDEPLSDPAVREAIGYALDREGIAAAAFQGSAVPIGSLAQEGRPGDYGATAVERDLDRVAELLDGAGYGDGISLTVLAIDGIDPNFSFSSAVQAQLTEAGIDAELLQATGSFEAFLEPLFGGEADIAAWRFSDIDTYYQFVQNLVPAGTLANPFGSTDEALAAALTTAGSASDLDAAMQEVATVYDELFWSIPVVLTTEGQLFSDRVANLPTEFAPQTPNAFSPDPANSWELID
ncbi:ABC transporter substrate-binding protein [Demequina pelophila]|uniref:ABC transporter substrate-binding protein n=1 Tax=Demequina pelophila TaxID=1638984 RepID=UPI0007827027|nr:ABC transporter substrate-binding protein [Demequina pelophila]